MDNNTINNIAEVLETIKKETITEVTKLNKIKKGDYIVIRYGFGGRNVHGGLEHIAYVKSSEFKKYFNDDSGFLPEDIQTIKSMKNGEVLKDIKNWDDMEDMPTRPNLRGEPIGDSNQKEGTAIIIKL